MNLRFYLITTIAFLILIVSGFYAGAEITYNLLFQIATNPYGEEALTFIPYAILGAVVGSIVGFLTTLLLIDILRRRWGPSLSFGSHPVLKLTFLSFLTFIGLLFLLLLLLYPSK